MIVWNTQVFFIFRFDTRQAMDTAEGGNDARKAPMATAGCARQLQQGKIRVKA